MTIIRLTVEYSAHGRPAVSHSHARQWRESFRFDHDSRWHQTMCGFSRSYAALSIGLCHQAAHVDPGSFHAAPSNRYILRIYNACGALMINSDWRSSSRFPDTVMAMLIFPRLGWRRTPPRRPRDTKALSDVDRWIKLEGGRKD